MLPVKRKCRGFRMAVAIPEENSNLASIQANGPTRTDTEVQHIITTYCETCPAWQPAAEKKKCKFCGCGATDTIENLHRRRIRNCPKGHWTEADIAQLTPSKNGLDS